MKVTFGFEIFSMHKFGGICRYFSELATHLQQIDGVQPTIISPLYITEYLNNVDKKIIKGVKVPAFRYTNRLRYQFSKNIYSIYNYIHKPDIIHKTYYSSSSPKKIPTVITVYDMIHEKFPQYFHKSISNIKMNACNSAERIICISQSTKQDLCDIFKIPETKISVIHLSHSLKTNPIQPSLMGKMPSFPYVLFVGNRDGYKNFGRFLTSLKAINQHSDVGLVCFGGGGFSATEFELIREVGYPINRIYQISGDDSLLSFFYQNANLFVFPSEYEGFGLPLLEAFYWGCPVACSKGSSFDEVAGEATLKFNPHNIEEMSYAIKCGLDKDKNNNPLIQLGYDRLKKFSWTKCAVETKTQYEHCLGTG